MIACKFKSRMFWPRKQDSKSAPANDSKNGIRLVFTAEKLLAPRHRQILLQEIQGFVSIPAKHYRALFETAIRNYASFVQELPASEIHHHSAPGGMLDHGLEVTKAAPEPFSGTITISTDGGSPQATKEAEILKHCADPETITDLPSFAATHSNSTNGEIIPTPSTPEEKSPRLKEKCMLESHLYPLSSQILSKRSPS